MLRLHFPHFFIPHRGVLKEDSLTTKLRVVLDASSHAAGKLSLNDCLYPGTNMITPLLGILLRARCTRYIIVADIEKAFHQVRLQEEYRNVTCFLWIKDLKLPPKKDNIVIYRFTRIPFGVSSSPFLLAAYILHHLNSKPHPLNKEIKENFYVDNGLFCTNEKSKIMGIISETKTIFNDMDMNLREYIVNDEETMKGLSPELKASADKIKLLGYSWDSTKDTLAVKVVQITSEHPTKREVASKLAATFDPLGLVSPIMVPFKRLIQKIWNTNVNWKQPIPVELIPDWTAIRWAFADKSIEIPRQVTQSYDEGELELLLFSDASQDIYAAAAYVYHIIDGHPPRASLLTSKSKIKPSKNDKWTIPKMELVAIECASQLASSIIKEIRIPIKRVRFFTDSSCALYWVLTSAQKRVWVANRVDTINNNQNVLRELGIDSTIHHVPTNQNPADLATRGLSTNDIRKNEFWFHGPPFLALPQDQWPCKIEGPVSCPAEFQDLVFSELIDPVTKKKKKPVMKKPDKTITQLHFTSVYVTFVPFGATNYLPKLIKIVYLFLQSISKLLRKSSKCPTILRKFLATNSLVEKMKISRCHIITEHYRDCESKGLQFPSFPPSYTDSNGIRRVRRNIASAVLPAEAHEPILIHNKHPLAALIINETHIHNGHIPSGYTRAAIRTKYWILKDGYTVDQTISKCVTCQRVNAQPFAYPFSKVLPACRTTPSKPFSKVGLDYLGPLTYTKDDGESEGKAYVLIYTCLNTRATMLRVVPDGTSERYIMTLKTIFGEVGVPEDIYSDNAATFKLGTKIINQDIHDLEFSESLTAFIASREVNYRNITPLAPWQGGIYERVVGLVKKHIQKVCGTRILDYHSLQYLVSAAQCMVNNRPLMPHTRSPNDIIALRPIDFMYPGVLIATPPTLEKSFPQGTTELHLRAHVAELDRTIERLWELWAMGYLLFLKQTRHKNTRCSTLLPRVGQVVIIDTPLVQRHKWPLGIITRVNPSKRDNEIRSAVVRCKGKEYERAVCQLIPLETEIITPLNHPAKGDQSGLQRLTDSQSSPVLPTPASFDNTTRFAPEIFPSDALENILEKTPKILNTESFNQNLKNHTTIGNEEYVPPIEEEENLYKDPSTPIPPSEGLSGRVFPGRSREYLPRKAKDKNINYVHTLGVEPMSLSRPRECHQSPAKGCYFVD